MSLAMDDLGEDVSDLAVTSSEHAAKLKSLQNTFEDLQTQVLELTQSLARTQAGVAKTHCVDVGMPTPCPQGRAWDTSEGLRQ